MKKLLFIVCALFVAGSAAAQDIFVIEGHVPTLPDSTQLRVLGNGMQPVVGFAVGGRFTFEVPLADKVELRLACYPRGGAPTALVIWGAPGVTARVTGDDNMALMWLVDSPVAEQKAANERVRINAANAKERAEYDNVLPDVRAEQKAAWDIYKDVMDIPRPEFTSEEQSKTFFSKKRKKLETIRASADSLYVIISDAMLSLMDDRKAPYSDVFVGKLEEISSMIYHYPNTYGSLRGRAAALYSRLSDSQKASDPGLWIEAALNPPTKVGVGDTLPDVELPDVAGNMHRLSEYTGKGKWVLLDFWASWCGPCVGEFPRLREFAEEFGHLVTLVGISLDERTEDWVRGSKQHNATWVNLHSKGHLSELPTRFRINGIPHKVLISPDGMILIDGINHYPLWMWLTEYIPELNARERAEIEKAQE